MRAPLLISAAVCLGFALPSAAKTATPSAEADRQAIAAAVADPGRSSANRARDQYRHPAETLGFFGVRPSDTVVEIWPGGGWYSEILGPLTKAKGKLYLAAPERALQQNRDLVAGKPALAHAVVAAFPNADGTMKVPDGTADVVLTFRNVHNWRFGGTDNAAEAFRQIFAMLKPGGILGVVDHRLPEEMDSALEEKSGYIKKSSVIAFATAAGFQLEGESEVNANPKDTHDWPGGVWTLPPTLRNGEVDREKYLAIGESDRFTLRFRKPK